MLKRFGRWLAGDSPPAIGAYDESRRDAQAPLGLSLLGAMSADAVSAASLPYDRNASLAMLRTHPMAIGAVHTLVGRTVGTGIALSADPDASVLGWTTAQKRKWKQTVEAEFRHWCSVCDLARAQKWYAMQDTAMRAALGCGDAWVLPIQQSEPTRSPYRLRLQLIEGLRVGNPRGQSDSDRMSQGVEFDPATGMITRVHFLPDATWRVGASAREGQWRDAWTPRGMPAVLGVMRRERPEQRRGTPYLAPVIGKLHQLDKFTNAELMAAVVAAMLTVFVKSEAPDQPLAPDSTSSSGDAVKLHSGAIVGLRPGEDVEVVNPGRPNPAFDPFVQAIIRQIGVGLELPHEVLTKHFQASYSASRAALLDAWITIRCRRQWMAETFCQPTYELFLEEAVALGRIAAPGFFSDPVIRGAYCKADWNGDSPGALDPVKEIEAATKGIEARVTTRERAAMELYGADWLQVAEQLEREAEELEARGLNAVQAAPGAAPAPAAPSNDGSPADGTDKEDTTP